MALVQSADYVAKRIYLGPDSVGAEVDLLDVYREVRALRVVNSEHRKYQPMIVAGGNVQKTATSFTQAYVQLLHGCAIVPYNAEHSLRIVREVFSDDGRYGVECFDRAGVAANVDIDMQVSPVEVRTVNVAGGSGLTPEQASQLLEIWRNAGLIPGLF